jgi:hypothetical protein
MLKPPSLRVPCIADVLPTVLDQLESDCTWAFQPVTFPVLDFQVYGSAARKAWMFHSDLDINVVTGMSREETLRLWQGRERKNAQEVIRRANALSRKWGLKFQFTFEHPQGAQHIAVKSCFGLRERIHHHPEAVDRIDIDPVTNAVTTRRPPLKWDYKWSFFDQDMNQHINVDPYPREEVEKWARRYGSKFQRIGETLDTAYLKH